MKTLRNSGAPRPRTLISACMVVSIVVGVLHVGFGQDASGSPYAGLETREIKTLSEDDVRQLLAGEGWGLALAAELNGVPGPLHLLEAVEHGQIHLTADQLARIRALRQDMLARVIPLGERLVEQERELNVRFAHGHAGEAELLRMLTAIGETTARLRYEHLVTHLQTARVLTAHQIARYNDVRGYTGSSGGDHAHDH